MGTRDSKYNTETVFLPGDEELFGKVVKDEWKLKRNYVSDALFAKRGRTRLFAEWPRRDDCPVGFDDEE